MDKKLTNELTEFITHTHNILSTVLLKIGIGHDLEQTEEDAIKDLFICYSENHLISIDDIAYKDNQFINTIINTRKKQLKIMGKLNLNTDVLNMDGKSFSSPESAYSNMLELMQKGVTPKELADYCKLESAKEPFTIKKAFKLAVLNSRAGKDTPLKSYESYKLAKKIDDELDFTTEELATIKADVGEVFCDKPAILGFLWDFIESK